MSKLKWLNEERAWGSGESLFLGKFKVGSVYYDAMQSKGGLKQAACCSLPGIKQNLGHYSTVQDAKYRVERAVNYWLVNSGLIEGSDA